MLRGVADWVEMQMMDIKWIIGFFTFLMYRESLLALFLLDLPHYPFIPTYPCRDLPQPWSHPVHHHHLLYPVVMYCHVAEG